MTAPPPRPTGFCEWCGAPSAAPCCGPACRRAWWALRGRAAQAQCLHDPTPQQIRRRAAALRAEALRALRAAQSPPAPRDGEDLRRARVSNF